MPQGHSLPSSRSSSSYAYVSTLSRLYDIEHRIMGESLVWFRGSRAAEEYLQKDTYQIADGDRAEKRKTTERETEITPLCSAPKPAHPV